MIFNLRYKQRRRGFSLVELMVTLVISGVALAAIYTLVGGMRKRSTYQRIKLDTESITQIAFFVMGRDIRRAGSNPAGAMGLSVGAEIPIGLAQNDQIRIYADLDGDGSIPVTPSDEDVTYQWVADPDDPGGPKDRILRQGGDQLVLENVRAFDLQYQLTGTTTWVTSTAATAAIRLVRMKITVGTGRIDVGTGVEATKTVQMDFMLRNFR